MADRVQVAEVTVPAGTSADTPAMTDLSFLAGTVTGIEIVIPPGHAGLTGLALAQAGEQVIPADTPSWIVGDSDKIAWPLDGFLNNGSWQAIAYNTDVYDHTFYLRFLITENADVPATSPLPVAAVSA